MLKFKRNINIISNGKGCVFILFKLKTFFIDDKKNLLRTIISILALGIIYFYGSREVKNLNIRTVAYLFHIVPTYKNYMLFIGGFIAASSMILYDYVVVNHFKYNVSLKKIWQISWICNTFNNFLGFAGLTGSALRSVLYEKEDIENNESENISLIITPATITGLSILSVAGIFNLIPVKSILEKNKFMWVGVIGFAVYLIIYFLLFKVEWLKKKIISEEFVVHKCKLLRVKLMVASIIEWITAGTFVWIISHVFTKSITYTEALAILTVASIAGIVSLMPAGIGAFDLVFLKGMQIMGANSNKAVVILLMYRLFYYVMPWIIGVIFSTIKIDELSSTSNIQKSLLNFQKIWFYKYEKIRDFVVFALSILVFLCGLMLLLSAATPGGVGRIGIAAKITSFKFLKFSHRISITVGLMLIVLSRGIKEHIKRAYELSMVLLLTGALFTFTKGLDYEEALFLLIVAFLLRFTRDRYYRESAPIKGTTFVLLLLITSLSVEFYALLGERINFRFLKYHRYYRHNRMFKAFLTRNQFMHNALYAFITAWIILLIWYFLRPKRPFDRKIGKNELGKLKEFLSKYEGNYLTHLLFLKDKNFYWAQDNKVLIAYANVRDKLIVLGDPIGDEECLSAAIQEFQVFADKYAMYPVFYQVSEKYLTTYHENGYYFFKLGEEAVVDLETFNLDGKKKKSLRNVKNKFEKSNFKFEVIEPPFSKNFIKELKAISDIWLGERKEKGFSLGWFDQEYIEKAGVAILKDEKDEIIAFATMMPKYDNHKTMSIDLMRFTKDSPNGTMDVLFINLFLWCQKEEYRYFNLGMAPLSNVGVTPFAHRPEKLAKLVYKFGSHWYGFSGLRKYKDKFTPEWESKFLAYPQFISLPILLLETARLVSKTKKKK